MQYIEKNKKLFDQITLYDFERVNRYIQENGLSASLHQLINQRVADILQETHYRVNKVPINTVYHVLSAFRGFKGQFRQLYINDTNLLYINSFYNLCKVAENVIFELYLTNFEEIKELNLKPISGQPSVEAVTEEKEYDLMKIKPDLSNEEHENLLNIFELLVDINLASRRICLLAEKLLQNNFNQVRPDYRVRFIYLFGVYDRGTNKFTQQVEEFILDPSNSFSPTQAVQLLYYLIVKYSMNQ